MIFNIFKSGYKKVQSALSRTRSLFGDRLRSLFSGGVDEEALEELEEILYEADLGVETAMRLVEQLRERLKKDPDLTSDQMIDMIRQELLEVMTAYAGDHPENPERVVEGPEVIFVVGVNGAGKTTAVAKLAKRYRDRGQKVLVVAADTFRAAAVEQLATWAERIDVDIVKGNQNSDPSAVVFDAMQASVARKSDVVIVDTAGRLQNRSNLMKELEKMRRSCKKVLPNKPDQTLLVLDANNGQNAVDQALTFHEYTQLTGLILTKLDATGKGGSVVPLQKKLGVPVQYIGLGEGVEDLEPFDAEQFVSGLLGG